MRLFKYDNIGPLDFTPEMNVSLQFHLINGIAIIMDKRVNIKLTYSFFRCQFNCLASNKACDVWRFNALNGFCINSSLNRCNCCIRKERSFMSAVSEKLL